MKSLNNILKIAGIATFLITFAVYFMSAERTGSLWDCGEFILGAYKLQIVHPPGAPLFMLVGRIFALFGDVVSSDPSHIAWAVNILSSICTSMAAVFISWVTIRLSSLFFDTTEEGDYDLGTAITLLGSGIVAGLTTAFCSSIWFSAVEGEVYAMSTFFTTLTVWAIVKWYTLADNASNDKWLIFACYATGLSIGVHLLGLLTFPALAVLVYLKKTKKYSLLGLGTSIVIGTISIPLIQKLIITGIPSMWAFFDIPLVNNFGLPFHSGLVVTIAIYVAIIYYALRYAKKKGNYWLHMATVSAMMIIIGYSTFGVILLRANADTPVNMNVPSDASRFLPYLNREQYGELPLLFGPAYDKSPIGYDREKRQGRVNFPPYNTPEKQDAGYTIVDEKIRPEYASKDKMLFPRIAHTSQNRPALYKRWQGGENPVPNFAFNIEFFFRYQVSWIFTRYFMWNFVGRQNGTQGYEPWNKSKGHWESGVKFVDEARLYNMDEIPESMKRHQANNHYYFLPFIFGFIGLLFHAWKKSNEFLSLVILFLITGIGIIIYTNSPPNEPRERDYVFIGSFFTFAIWIGMAIPALYKMIKEKFNFSGMPVAAGLSALVLSAPLIMGFQNFDDHSRKDHKASSDYAKNFLNSLDENAILFTYGDNDTYPLWYAQEVEDVRRDVRIVNLSLITVDWYINKLRSKVNESEAIKMSIPAPAYRGNKRNQVPYYNQGGQKDPLMNIKDVLRVVGGNNPVSGSGMNFESYMPTHKMYIETDMAAVQRMKMINPADKVQIESRIPIDLGSKSWIQKDELAILDLISSNIWERPIYFATTCQNSKLLGLNDYMQYEGLALRIIPVKTPSDRRLQIYGSGRMETHRLYDNIMNKWKWGNFDQLELHVDNSYGAALQAHRMVMLRTAESLFNMGETQKAIDIVNKFFEAFPHMNFPYDASVAPFLSVYIQAGAYEEAKKHARILAVETADYLDFYASIDRDIIASSFQQDFAQRNATVQTILSLTRLVPDENFKKEMTDLLTKYQTRQVPN